MQNNWSNNCNNWGQSKINSKNEGGVVLDFVEFLKAKRRRELESPAKSQHRESDLEKADMSEFDQFGSVYDGHFDRDACCVRPNLRRDQSGALHNRQGCPKKGNCTRDSDGATRGECASHEA
jgi:hypothetical protein